MGLITDPYNFANGGIADADQVDERFLRLYDLVNGLLDEDNLNLAELSWLAQNAEEWTDFAYTNGWATQAGEQAAGYYKQNGIVRLRGVMTGAAATAQVPFTLPAGYRPETRLLFPMNYWDSNDNVWRAGSIAVQTSGTVPIDDNTASAGVASDVTIVSLAHVAFRAA